MSAASARSVALAVVRRVTEEGAYSNIALSAGLERSGLAPRDRALATELAYGTLRRLVALDWALGGHVDRPLERAPPRARALLRLGAFQLLETRIPPHAAVAETVALAAARERGFVNAVLRALATARPAPPSGSSDDALAVRTGVAPWIVREIRELLGDEAEEAARALATQAPLSLRTNTCRVAPEELERALEEAGHPPRRGAIHPETMLVRGADPSDLPGYEEGWFAVQDEASAFVVAALHPETGERALDVCAGPGGKAGHIACLVGPLGLAVAADVKPSRARMVVGAGRRLGVRIAVLAQDGRRPALRGGFDRILVDAPCSGIGAARRRPELLWRPRPGELRVLAGLQVDIAASAVELLRPGGTLMYSVCTFPSGETDGVCDALLHRRPDLAPIEIDGPDGAASRVRLWPHRHGTDAMFVAAFRRREGTPR